MLLLHARAGLGATLHHLHVGGKAAGSSCQSLLQTLRRSLAAPPSAPRQAADKRRLHIAASSSRSNQEAAVENAPHKQKSEPSRQKHQQQQPAIDGAAPEPPPVCSTTSAVGQVMAAQANFVRVKVDALEGGEPGEAPPRTRLLCVVRALLKKIKQEVLVGDRVRLVGIDWTDGRGMVEEVLPRTSQLSEPAVANVSHVLLVFSAALPGFQPSPATRYLLSAEAAWLPVTVAINKADLLTPEDVQAVVGQVSSWGYRTVAVSVVSGEGLEELTEVLRGRVTVVAGPSGAGKSSIINALRLQSLGLEGSLGAMQAEPSGAAAGSGSGSEDDCSGEEEEEEEGHGIAPEAASGSSGSGGHAEDAAERQQDGVQPPAGAGQQQQRATVLPAHQQQAGSSDGSSSDGSSGSSSSPQQLPADLELQAVGQVSERIGRGKHTTRNVTLLELEGSGGGLVVDTPGFNQPDLALPATELWQHFPEIRRLVEEERCAFRGCQHLQEPGCVVREAGWERYPLYREIHGELKALEEVQAQRQASKKRREGSVRMKSRAGGQQGVEARLETKAHRRVSRRSVKQRLSDLVKDVEEDDVLL